MNGINWKARWSADQLRAMLLEQFRLEDERFLGFAADDANDLYALLVELFGQRSIFIYDTADDS